MKKLHVFILKSYLNPLIMTFFISLFILVMQFLWRYVDDLVGKGLDIFVLAELLFYASLQVIPLALPLAILLASLMTFGNLGENYELTALKSAGISLPRIMAPLIAFTILVSVAAFKFSNNILPVANLKLYSLLWSVRQTSPEFDIKEKVFYDGLTDFTIKIDHKSKTSDMLYGIMIYDHRNKLAKNSNVTLADSGKLQFSEDKNFLKLTLYNGVKYDENVNEQKGRIKRSERQQFRVDNFTEQIAMIPMQGFNFNRFDEGLFKSNDKMKNLEQLNHDTDSLQKTRLDYIAQLRPRIQSNYLVHYRKHRVNSSVKKPASIDSIPVIKSIEDHEPISADSTFEHFEAKTKLSVIKDAIRRARDAKNLIDEQIISIDRVDHSIVRHLIQWHRKFTLSFACFIFFFIGAPLGAIIRKGGLGMPVVISVLFFIVYYILDTFGLKISKEEVWPPHLGIWLSSAILFPVGVFLTYKAATDSAILNADAYRIFFYRLFSRFKQKKGVK
jgi:lipopolysaccharide export system permease protein